MQLARALSCARPSPRPRPLHGISPAEISSYSHINLLFFANGMQYWRLSPPGRPFSTLDTSTSTSRFRPRGSRARERSPASTSSASFSDPKYQSEKYINNEFNITSSSEPWETGKVPAGFWADVANQLRYLNWLGQRLNYKSKEDWYKVSNKDFLKHGGRAFLLRFDDSASKALTTLYSDHPFLPWLFRAVPKFFFASSENRKWYINWLVSKLGVSSPAELQRSDFLANHGGGLLAAFGGSSEAVMQSTQISASPADLIVRTSNPFDSGPGRIMRDHWSTMENQVRFLDDIGSKIGVQGSDLTPWYSVSSATLHKYGCASLLDGCYNGSIFSMVQKVYPEHTWIPWKFQRIPALDGNDFGVLKRALDFIESEKQLVHPEDWYRISGRVLKDLGVYPVISSVGGLHEALVRVRGRTIGGFDWEKEKFESFRLKGETVSSSELTIESTAPSLKETDTQRSRKQCSVKLTARARDFLRNLGKKLNIPEDNLAAWYNVDHQTMQKGKGFRLLEKFNWSRFEILSVVYPEHTWYPWLFKRWRGKKGASEELAQSFARHLERKLQLTRPEEWYRVTPGDLSRLDLADVFSSQSDLLDFLRRAYPSVNWEPQKMAWSSRGMSHLRATLETLLPGMVGSAKGVFPEETLNTVALHVRAIPIPDLKLLVEYQGPIDYAKQILAEKETLELESHSELKSLADREGYTLLSVPFWWNRELGSLLASIFNAREDLFESNGPLAKFSVVARTSDPIPEVTPRAPLNMSTSYIRLWTQDPRFSDGLVKDSEIRLKAKVKERRPRKALSVGSRSRLTKKSQISKSVNGASLQREYDFDPKPGLDRRKALATELGVDLGRLTGWFKRQRKAEGYRK